MKKFRQILAFVLCFTMLFSFSFTSAAADSIEKELWDMSFNDESESFKAAVTLFPGKDETERTVAWYSESAEGYVELTHGGKTEKITAEANATPQGDYRLSATITNLEKKRQSVTCTCRFLCHLLLNSP